MDGLPNCTPGHNLHRPYAMIDAVSFSNSFDKQPDSCSNLEYSQLKMCTEANVQLFGIRYSAEYEFNTNLICGVSKKSLPGCENPT